MAVKPGTAHPTKPGLVMGNNKRYVAKGTYAKQKANASKPTPPKTSSAKPGGNFRAPNVPKPKPRVGRLAKIGKNLSSLTAAKAVADSLKPVTDSVAKEAARGASIVTGGNTKALDRMNAGKPVVKSVGGVDFNVSTAAGRRGYQKALTKKKQQEQGSTSGRGAGRAAFRVDPKTPPKKTPPKNTPPKNTPPKNTPPKNTPPKKTPPKPAKDRGKRDYGSKAKNMAAWRKANPALAKALDKRNAAKAKRLEESKAKRAKKRGGGTLYSGRTNNSKMA